jgi:hypothetical protein
MDKVFQYEGNSDGHHRFTCTSGFNWVLWLEFYDCYVITGPVPKQIPTEAERSSPKNVEWDARNVVRKNMPDMWVDMRFAAATTAAIVAEEAACVVASLQ